MLTVPIIKHHHNRDTLRNIVKYMPQERRNWKPKQSKVKPMAPVGVLFHA